MEKQKLPNGTAVLVLGILSIIGCCCYGIVGLILSIIAIVLAKNDVALYNANPELYSNYSELKTGRILAIIGIILSTLFLIIIISFYSYMGMDALQNEELMQEKIRELLGQ